jgi:hypothetical protein
MDEIVALRQAIRSIEERLALIEAFLDTELSERQHRAQSGLPINPWYGASLKVKASV